MVRRDSDAPLSVVAIDPAAETPEGFETLSSPAEARTVKASGLGSAQTDIAVEWLTAEVADCIWEHLHPVGVAVVIEASHACMTARGVQTPGVMMTTSRMMGVFREDERSRREVLALMGY